MYARFATPLGAAALGLSALACTGGLSADAGSMSAAGGTSNNGNNGAAGAAAGEMGVGQSGAATVDLDPGRKDIHRLNSAEYNATATDVLGATLQPANASWRSAELAGFDNIASVLGIDDAQYERYFTAAEALAEEVFASPALKARIVTCTTVDDIACVQSVISAAGLRVFRRPLGPEEITTYQNVYSQARAIGDDHDTSLKLVLRALLSSAEFLYRIEYDDPAAAGKHPLGAFELASRLSYFLWSSAPDDALLQAATSGALLSDATLTETVDRMLADPKATRLIQNFAGQWLGGRAVTNHAVDATLFPSFTPTLASAMAQEVYQFFGEFVSTDRPWSDFLKADINFVDAELAAHYQFPTPAAGARAEVTTDARHGFFGLGGFLAVSSMTTRTSPTLRGRWILNNLLCSPPPDPPPGIPELEISTEGAMNIRQMLELHRTDPSCAACHAMLDPYGLALEQFDAIGRHRTTYADGTTIDTTTSLPASPTYPDGVSFVGLSGLTDTMSQNPKFTECVTRKLFTYGLGRVIAPTDEPYLAEINRQWVELGEPPTIRRLVRGLVLAETFRYRRGEGTL